MDAFWKVDDSFFKISLQKSFRSDGIRNEVVASGGSTKLYDTRSTLSWNATAGDNNRLFMCLVKHEMFVSANEELRTNFTLNVMCKLDISLFIVLCTYFYYRSAIQASDRRLHCGTCCARRREAPPDVHCAQWPPRTRFVLVSVCFLSFLSLSH